MSRSRHHNKWFFLTFSNFHFWSHFCHVPSWGDIGILRSLVRPRVRPSVPPSVRLFTTFSGFCALADKSLGRNGIKFGMLMYPDDLLSADINADGYFVISCVCPPVQLSVRLGFSTAYKSPGQKSLHFGYAGVSRRLASVYWHLWVSLSARPFFRKIFRFLCICWQIIWKEWHKIWHADIFRWLTLIRHRC